MWDKLNLSLAECRVYAYIYGLTFGEAKGYKGSKRQLAKLLGLDAGGVKKCLDNLAEMNLIVCNEGLWQSVDSVNKSVDSVNKSVDSVNSPHTPLYNINKINKKDSVSRKRANTTPEFVILKQNYFEITMESLDDAMKRKESVQVMWQLLKPAPEFRNLFNDFMRYWNRIERINQLRIWYFIKRKVDTKQPLDPNPLEVIKNCRPYPLNYNGTHGINDMIKSDRKMVKAYYNGSYGIYEQMDARLWNMTRVEPLNY